MGMQYRNIRGADHVSGITDPSFNGSASATFDTYRMESMTLIGKGGAQRQPVRGSAVWKKVQELGLAFIAEQKAAGVTESAVNAFARSLTEEFAHAPEEAAQWDKERSHMQTSDVASIASQLPAFLEDMAGVQKVVPFGDVGRPGQGVVVYTGQQREIYVQVTG